MPSLNLPRDELEYQYITLNKTQKECAEHFDCHYTTIAKYLIKYDIPISRTPQFKLIDELMYLFFHQGLSRDECADIFNLQPRQITQLIGLQLKDHEDIKNQIHGEKDDDFWSNEKTEELFERSRIRLKKVLG